MDLLLRVCVTIVLGQAAPSASAPASQPDSERVIRFFDFDETRLGNFEETPMRWTRRTGRGFPRYQSARFDRQVGHSAPPSLRLSVQGGSVATTYEGDDIPARPQCMYRVLGWVRLDRLHYARAVLSAQFVDDAAHPLANTQRRVEIGGVATSAAEPTANDGTWRLLSLDLPAAPESAKCIHIGCAVMQSAAADDLPRRIDRQDLSGGAWFDDIVVLRMPRLEFTCDSPTGVFTFADPATLRVRVSDVDPAGITARVDVTQWGGERAATRPLRISTVINPPEPLALPELRPGWYRASLIVDCGQLQLLRQTLSFAVLPQGPPAAATIASPLGTLLDAPSGASWPLLREALRRLHVGCAKVPLWSKHVTPADVVRGDPAMDSALHDLRDDGVRIVALLAQPPAALASQFEPGRRSLLDVLSSDPARWRPYLALPIARYGGVVTAWQIGPDSPAADPTDPRLADVVKRVQDELSPLIGPSGIVVAMSCLRPLPAGLVKGASVCVSVPAAVTSGNLPEQLSAPGIREASGRWAMLTGDGGADDEGASLALAEFARRIIVARAAGVEQVYVPQPWRVATPGRLEPTPEFLVVRALARALAGATAATWLPAPDGATGLLFGRADGTSVLTAWTNAGDGAEWEIPWSLGTDAVAYDMLGRPIDAAQNRPLRVASTPVIVMPVNGDLLRQQMAVRLEGPPLPMNGEVQARTVIVRNELAQALNATLRLSPPSGWTIKPREWPLRLEPGQEARTPISIRIPTYVAGGDYHVAGRLVPQGKDGIDVSVSLRITLAAPGIEARAWLQRVDDRLLIRQRVVNRGEKPLNARAFLVAPGTARQARAIRELRVGDGVWLEFALADASRLRGQPIRLTVESLDGAVRHNQVLNAP